MVGRSGLLWQLIGCMLAHFVVDFWFDLGRDRWVDFGIQSVFSSIGEGLGGGGDKLNYGGLLILVVRCQR